jgi:hypothetical protein
MPDPSVPPNVRRVNFRYLAVGGLIVLLLLPVWCAPLVATQDGPSHLYNASIVSEALAGRGPSTAVFQVSWKPLPNWTGTLVLVGLLNVLPLAFIPRVMLTITGIAPLLATLWFRKQTGRTGAPERTGGIVWIAAFAGCLATGRAWALGFESFSLGAAAAVAAVALYARGRDRLDLLHSLGISALLAFTYFCHPVPWAFAVLLIGVLLVVGASHRRQWLWTAIILCTALPFLLLYRNLSAGQAGGLQFDWSHLKGFRLLAIRYWLMLAARADCVSVMKHVVPFTSFGSIDGESAGSSPHGTLARFFIVRLFLDPFVLLTAAVALQTVGTFMKDMRVRDYRRLGWAVLGFAGMLAALFIPDGTAQNGSLLPFRAMLLSITLLVAYVRFDVNRFLTLATSLLIGLGFALHLAAIWDFTTFSDRQMRDVQMAAAKIPPGERIYQVGTPPRLRFEADPGLHRDAYAALWSRGVLMSNYEAAHYYFPVKLRPTYPQSLVTEVSQLQELDAKQAADRERLRKFLADHQASIDVLLVRTADPQLVTAARQTFGDVLWHNDAIWALRRPIAR